MFYKNCLMFLLFGLIYKILMFFIEVLIYFLNVCLLVMFILICFKWLIIEDKRGSESIFEVLCFKYFEGWIKFRFLKKFVEYKCFI